MSDQVTVIFDQAAMSALLVSDEIAADLERRAINVEGAAKRNATDRPGPRVQTGRLRASITHQMGRDGQGLFAQIGSDVEYARRIELGFEGVDALGREYHQPPFPYLRPALGEAAR
jgi:hypothetical protein